MTRRAVRYLAVLVVATLLVVVPISTASAAPGPADAPEWWFDTWQVPALWAAGARGQGITIGEIDTGVQASVPELTANVLPGKDFGDPSLDGRTDHATGLIVNSNEHNSHGTAMASLMVAQPGTYGITGLAPDAKVLPVAVPIEGTDDYVPGGDDHVDDAIRYAADSGAKIISLSLGGAQTDSPGALPCPPADQSAVTYAIGKGAIVVAAAGNEGVNSPVEDPAVCLGVVSVGAVDSNNQVASFSSRQPFLTVSAPGAIIPGLTLVPGQAYKGSGTSQATAITSAALALIWSAYPTLTGRQIVARLLATLDRASTVRDPAYGYGIINPEKAINTAVPANAPNPVFAALDPFVARAKAAIAVPTAPAGAPARQALPAGSAQADPAPSALTGRVMTGLLVGIGGAVAFLVLSIFGFARWRRRRYTPEPAVGIPYAALAYPAAPVGRNGRPEPTVTQPDSGVVWHDVTDIEPSSPFHRGRVSKS